MSSPFPNFLHLPACRSLNKIWRAVWDETHGAHYYKRRNGGDSTWAGPFDYVPRAEYFEEHYNNEERQASYFWD